MDDPHGSIVRWQSTLIVQFTYAINLILGFSVAALGFQITTMLGREINYGYYGEKTYVDAALLSLIFLGASVLLGIPLVLNRLKDFRLTAKIARQRKYPSPTDTIAADRDLSEKLGRKTWCLFQWQLGTFGIGVVMTIVGVAILFFQKLSLG